MSSKKVHLDQAEHNAKVANSLVDGEYYDWSCTCAFYAALHYVEANFSDVPEIQHTDKVYEENKEELRSEDAIKSVHWYRGVLIKKRFSSTVRLAYTHLQATSEICRYLGGHDKTACEVITQETAKELVQKKLAIIKKELGF